MNELLEEVFMFAGMVEGCRAFSTDRDVLKGNVKDAPAETQNLNTHEKGVLSQRLQLSSNVLQQRLMYAAVQRAEASYCESTLC